MRPLIILILGLTLGYAAEPPKPIGHTLKGPVIKYRFFDTHYVERKMIVSAQLISDGYTHYTCYSYGFQDLKSFKDKVSTEVMSKGEGVLIAENHLRWTAKYPNGYHVTDVLFVSTKSRSKPKHLAQNNMAKILLGEVKYNNLSVKPLTQINDYLKLRKDLKLIDVDEHADIEKRDYKEIYHFSNR